MTSYKSHQNTRYYQGSITWHIVLSDLIILTGDPVPLFVSEQAIIDFIDAKYAEQEKTS